MINVLFVDDEPNILDGLKRMLRPMRREWQMFFAFGGEEALKILTEKNIDIVISDMKMPGMDGARFLQKVQSQYPQIVRIILSGYSEREMILSSVGATHQYLSKPCDAETLKSVVARACALRDLLTNETLRRIVSQMNSVPSLPTLYAELMKEINSPHSNMRNIGRIVKQDMGMTVKILQIINSSFFSLRRSVSDADEAINFLGLEVITSLALGIGIFSQFESTNKSSDHLSHLWQKSMKIGTLAQTIAKAENSAVANDAFTAGLLHEIGKVIMAANLPEQFAETKKMDSEESILEAEKRIFGSTHAEIGAYLLGLWGLPHQVVEAVAFYNNPPAFSTGSFAPLTAVYIAEVFYRHGNEKSFTVSEKFFKMEYLEELGISEKVKIWHQEFVTNN